MERKDGRAWNELRNIEMNLDFIKFAQSSVLISFGDTKVIVSATLEASVPPFVDSEKSGWLTAEYGLLPASCGNRIRRPTKGADGRTKEIQRLIGRSMRAVTDLTMMPGWTLVLDCDVLQGDGGTRTTSISGAYVAAYVLFEKKISQGVFQTNPLKKQIAAVSCGYTKEGLVLDLCYEEDSQAIIDANVVMTGNSEIVELQVSGEKGVITEKQLNDLFLCGKKGITEIIAFQKKTIEDYFSNQERKDV